LVRPRPFTARPRRTASKPAVVDVGSEQTTAETFRVTITPDGRVGVAVFVDGKPSVVLWLGSGNRAAAERLALHLETQVDRVSCSPA
jgi:hypothetical protein